MKRPYFLLVCLILASCSSEREEEPDYENIVMVEEDPWVNDEERDRKIIAIQPPDPQELLILEFSEI